jgi:hypothetical protein
VLSGGGAELRYHDRAGDPAVRSDPQRVPGVVIEPGQDLGIGPIREWVVGEVGLPALVGLLGGEPQVGRLRPLRRVGVTNPARARYRLTVDARKELKL